MRKVFAVAAAIVLLYIAGIVSAEAYDWTEYQGHLYALTTWGTWQECEAAAQAAGGYLVTINDVEENAWVTSFIRNSYSRYMQGDPGNNIAWIGYNNGVWSSGEPVTYTNMEPGHAAEKVFVLGENYAAWYRPPGLWFSGYNTVHDTNYSYNPQGVIEVVPSPHGVINLAANQYGDVGCWPDHPTYALTLPAGDWAFDLVSPATNSQATYWAWQPWGGVANWHTAFAIFDGTNRYILGTNNAASDQQEAFWQSINNGYGRVTLHLDTETTLHLGVSDSYIGDNGGGISVLVSAVPEPSSLLALASGLGTLLTFRMRRKA